MQRYYEEDEKKEPKIERGTVWELRDEYVERIRRVEEQEIRDGTAEDSQADGWWL
jgi:hypothetical protein